jgi:hypothetical protein
VALTQRERNRLLDAYQVGLVDRDELTRRAGTVISRREQLAKKRGTLNSRSAELATANRVSAGSPGSTNSSRRRSMNSSPTPGGCCGSVVEGVGEAHPSSRSQGFAHSLDHRGHDRKSR